MKMIITLLLLIVCTCGAKAQIITTVAGGGTGGLGDGGPAVYCELLSPYGIALDNIGNLYIADRDHNRIRKMNNSGIITTIAGTGSSVFNGDNIAATSANISIPLGITSDASGNIYFSDRGNNRVRKIDEAGVITTIAGGGTGGTGDGGPATAAVFNGPGYLKFDRFGNLYVSDLFNNRIRMINTSGIISTIAGTGVGINTGDGGQATAAGVNNPYGIVFDNAGNLYFTEYDGNRVRKINTTGIITTIAGNDTAGFRGDSGLAINAEVNHPDDIAIDASGNLYITDQGNQRVRRITTDGIINTVAGNGIDGFNGDGNEALLTEFRDPTGILVDHAGSLYIADLGNDRIRYLRNTVSVSTLNNVPDEVSVYPNPSDGTFNILVSSKTSKQVSVSIVDQLGRMIRQLPVQTNEVTTVQEHIPPGAYFLSVKDGTNATETAKLFIR
jgi:sugar lactone lactonase YvrE